MKKSQILFYWCYWPGSAFVWWVYAYRALNIKKNSKYLFIGPVRAEYLFFDLSRKTSIYEANIRFRTLSFDLLVYRGQMYPHFVKRPKFFCCEARYWELNPGTFLEVQNAHKWAPKDKCMLVKNEKGLNECLKPLHYSIMEI